MSLHNEATRHKKEVQNPEINNIGLKTSSVNAKKHSKKRKTIVKNLILTEKIRSFCWN